MTAVLFFLQLAVAAYGGDYPRHFAQLTDMTRKICDDSANCLVTQNKDNQKFQIVFKTTPGKGETIISSVSINAVNGKGEDFKLPVPKAVATGDATPIFAADVNGDGFNDLALQAGIGSRTGYVYYYWIYNPKAKRFAFTKSMNPALQVVKGKMVSLTTYDEYRVNNKFEIQETKKIK